MNTTGLPESDARCGRCAAPLMGGAPDGLCPRCLLIGALNPPPEDDEFANLQSPAVLLATRKFAGYEIIEEIARGGMGVVFRARQKKPDRVVALKVIAAGELASPRMVERFRTEAGAAARLDHPNIVPIYEVGHHDGWHFFSMRFIEGGTLEKKSQGRGLAPVEAARLLVKLARAVQHAHERGVLHRDLKPNNVLLDQLGEPHLTDFGLAKIVEGSVEMTASNSILGTPAYMPPEQIAGGARDLTVTADIYGLGAVLYEMLAGRPPFEGPNPHALLRKIAEEDPLPPRRRESASAVPALQADLEAICLKCLEKEPERRYRSAAELIEDTENALRGELIQARPSTATQRMHKWVRRHPAQSGLVLISILALVVITIGSLAFNVRLNRARAIADANEAASRHALLIQDLRENGRLNSANEGFAGLAPLIDAARLCPDEPDERRSVAERIAGTLQNSPRLMRVWDAGGIPAKLQFSKDGRRLIAILQDGEVCVWNLAAQNSPKLATPRTGARAAILDPNGSQVLEFFDQPPYASLRRLTDNAVVSLPMESNQPAMSVFSPDSKIVAIGGVPIRLWSTVTGERLSVAMTNDSPVLWMCFSRDGETLLTVHERDRAYAWNVATGALVKQEESPVFPWIPPQLDQEGERLLCYSTNRIKVLRWRTGETMASVPSPENWQVIGMKPDGRQFATGGFQEPVRIWNTSTSEPYGQPVVHEGGVNKIMFSPDGAWLTTAGFDYQLRLLHTDSQKPAMPTVHRTTLIQEIAFSDDSRFLAAGDAAGCVQVWDLSFGAQPLLVNGEAMARMANTPDGRWMILAGHHETFHVFNLETGELQGQPITVPGGVVQISLDAEPGHIALALGNRGLQIRDFSTGQMLLELKPGGNPALENVRQVAFRPDGSEFATATSRGLLQLWRTSDGQPLGSSIDLREPANMICWSPNGRWICSGGGRSAEVWDARSGLSAGKPIVGGPLDTFSGAQFDPAADRIAIAFGNADIEPSAARIYTLPGLQPTAGPLRHGDGVSSVRFSPVGALIATGGEDNVVHIWRATDGSPVTGELRHRRVVSALAFRTDGRVLASGAADGAVNIWETVRGDAVMPPMQFNGGVSSLVFSKNGRRLYVSTGGAASAVWVVDLPVEPPGERQLEVLAEAMTGMRAGIPMTAQEVAGAFASLHDGQTGLEWPQDLRPWHKQQAVLAELRGDWFSAVFHLDRLAKETPDDASILSRLSAARRKLISLP